ncbi:MAG: hypothetical protein OYH77_06380 [Pseudomonadota bacterium]|nr:hypothetical protein [Pseudomonadota bacterium]
MAINKSPSELLDSFKDGVDSAIKLKDASNLKSFEDSVDNASNKRTNLNDVLDKLGDRIQAFMNYTKKLDDLCKHLKARKKLTNVSFNSVAYKQNSLKGEMNKQLERLDPMSHMKSSILNNDLDTALYESSNPREVLDGKLINALDKGIASTLETKLEDALDDNVKKIVDDLWIGQ